MEKLKCDICGGSIMVQPGGQVAVCESCGARYSIGHMCEKMQEITGTIRVEGTVQARQTGTEDDVSRWRSLLDKYYRVGDFQAVENIVKKILEAAPSDEQANKMYDELQVLKFMEIKNGVLLSYSGQAESLVIPNCVEKIEDEAFKWNKMLKDVAISFGVKEIGRGAFQACRIELISIPNSVQKIGDSAFEACCFLSSIKIPVSVTSIGFGAFRTCPRLVQVEIPEELYKESLFITDYSDREDLRRDSPRYISPWYVKRYQREQERSQRVREQRFQEQMKAQQKERQQREVCQHCGGSFSGLFTRKCSKCGKPKDY